MRVVSLVPSWTETLIEAGVHVVGRTRYCIHPSPAVASIPIVGGTKEVDWDLIIDLNPDLILFDKEENPLSMAEECQLPYIATHVSSLESLVRELHRMGEIFKNEKLFQWSSELAEILQLPRRHWDADKIPGLVQAVQKSASLIQSVVYLIWKNPWMSVSSQTYIGSVLQYLGAPLAAFGDEEKYPVIEPEEFKECFFLYSSEPFPFHKKIAELKKLGYSGAVVDGESYSWFGVRSLRFLKKLTSN